MVDCSAEIWTHATDQTRCLSPFARQQATDLYSLAEIKLPKGTVRKDASYAKDYFRGRYGAIPYLGEFEALLKGEEGADGEAC